MNQVKVSPKYQVVIPREIREELHIRPGQKMLVIAGQKSITFVPDMPIRSLMGSLKGMDTSNIREKVDREI